MRDPRRQEGAVLFIVLMTIMLATSSAIFAIHNSAIEVRGTGFARQNTQTQYAAKAAINAALEWGHYVGIGAILRKLETEGVEYVDNYPEINLSGGRRLLRLSRGELAELVSPSAGPFQIDPIVDAATYGSFTGMKADRTVTDFYDFRRSNRARPGESLGGGGSFVYVRYSMTARAIGQFDGDFTQQNVEYGYADGHDQRAYHSTMNEIRAYVTSPLPVAR